MVAAPKMMKQPMITVAPKRQFIRPVSIRKPTAATAITAGMTVHDVVDLDLAYAPPFSSVWDPVQVAARALVKEL